MHTKHTIVGADSTWLDSVTCMGSSTGSLVITGRLLLGGAASNVITGAIYVYENMITFHQVVDEVVVQCVVINIT